MAHLNVSRKRVTDERHHSIENRRQKGPDLYRLHELGHGSPSTYVSRFSTNLTPV